MTYIGVYCAILAAIVGCSWAKYSSGDAVLYTMSHQMENSNSVNLFYRVYSDDDVNVYVLDTKNKKLYDSGDEFEFDRKLSQLGTISCGMSITEYSTKDAPGYVQIESATSNKTRVNYVIDDENVKNCFYLEIVFMGCALAIVTMVVGCYIGHVRGRSSMNADTYVKLDDNASAITVTTSSA
uniref:Uncharacterized protein n=1 Tax=viral metagenome TaxID=1070528 RepID=A0A6C0LYV0_9ZZZZ